MTFRRIFLLPLACLLLASACSDSNIGTNNSPPEVTILQPEDGYTVAEGVEVTFEGRAEDRGTDAAELEMRWSSSLDELLHEGLREHLQFLDRPIPHPRDE